MKQAEGWREAAGALSRASLPIRGPKRTREPFPQPQLDERRWRLSKTPKPAQPPDPAPSQPTISSRMLLPGGSFAFIEFCQAAVVWRSAGVQRYLPPIRLFVDRKTSSICEQEE